jgi:hypothetical protein
MNRSLLITCSVAFLCFAAPAAVAEEDSPVFGTVKTTKKTAVKVSPSAHAAAATLVGPNTDLRWVRGEAKGKYVRVMVPKGPLGWVLAADVNKVAAPDLSGIALEAQAQPCVSPETLDACTTKKPTGCSPATAPTGWSTKRREPCPQRERPSQ